ncbi:MAG TPA: metallophosphoesterase family protein [Solirubrobacteraceae bacterium]|nr:metallophosphoesterase family protein [Solirubrobacteraceae bacterium]
MRYAILADVHANLHALEAVLAALERERPDRWIVAGDLVGYGPHPDECVARVLALDPAACVAGNHDLIAIGRLSADRCIPLARESLEWTAAVIGDETRAALGALPLLAREGDLVVAHGSLDDPQEYIRTEERAHEELARLAVRHPEARALVVGHTHRPMRVEARGSVIGSTPGGPLEPARGTRLLLNPGAVGQSRDARPVTRALVLDWPAGEARPVEVDYDVAAAKAALRERGLDPLGVHLPPAPFPGAYRLRRIARRVSRRTSPRRRTGR